MTDFFDRKDPWGNGMAVWVVMIMVFAIPLATWSLRQTRLENDVEKWLPKDDPELKILQWANDKFSFEERVFVTWDGSALNDPRIDLFINKLRGHLDHEGIRREGVPHIARALEPRELLLIMQQNGVGPQEAARRLEGLVIGAGSLKLKLTEFAKSGLRESKQELIAAAKSQFGIDLKFSEPVPDFWTLVAIPTPPAEEGGAVGEPSTPAVMNAAGTLIDSDSVTHDLQVTWKGMRPGSDQTLKVVQWLKTNESVRDPGRRFVEDAFFALGSPVTIALALSEAGLSDKQEAVAQIRQAASAVGISADSLHMAGSTISTTELNREVGKAVWDPAFPVQQFHRRSVIMTSAVISTVLAYLLLRSIRLATIVLIVSVYATMVSTSLVSATGGAMNMVLVVMPLLREVADSGNSR